MNDAVVAQARVVRAGIERMASDYGPTGAEFYIAGLLVGVVGYLIRTRGRRYAFETMQIYTDEILTPELPQ